MKGGHLGGYIGVFIGDYKRNKGDTRSLDYSSYIIPIIIFSFSLPLFKPNVIPPITIEVFPWGILGTKIYTALPGSPFEG